MGDTMNTLMTLSEAASWATEYLHKNVTNSNIAYLIAYAHIKKYDDGGAVKVSLDELAAYYEQHRKYIGEKWDKEQAGKGQASSDGAASSDLNWALSFDTYKEAETTKHVHRLHPYKGKFIPQLAEYFLDARP